MCHNGDRISKNKTKKLKILEYETMYRRIVYKRKETIDPSWVWFIHNNLYINNINSNSGTVW